MKRTEIVFLSLLVIVKFSHGFVLSDEEYERVPHLYEMDDYEECRHENHIHCKIRMRLKPKILEEPNEVWDIIQKLNQNPEYYDHASIYRYRCIDARLGERGKIIEQALQIENRSLERYSLTATVEDVVCKEYKTPEITNYDYGLLYFFICYLLLNISATLITAQKPESVSKYVRAFSLISNWQSLKEPINNSDYQRLKSMQGLRSYNMFVVISGHCFGIAATLFRTNPKFFEEGRSLPFSRWGSSIAPQFISTFFLMSSWLLANEVHKAYNARKQFTLTDIGKAILNRYIRILPPLAFVVAFERSNWLKILLDGPINEFLESDNMACKTNWWATLLLINNIFNLRYQCNCMTWYLATDFQLFLIALLIYYISFKYKLGNKLLFSTIILFWCYHSYIIYKNDYRMYLSTSIEDCHPHKSLESEESYALHLSLYSNYASYGIGLIFGSIYFKYKEAKIPKNKILDLIWLILFFGMPSLDATICFYESLYSPLMKALIGGSLKPIYTLGIAVGILGMSFDIGGPIKAIYESKPLEILAKIGYCVYIYHLIAVFPAQSLYKNIINLTAETLIQKLATDLVLSLLLGLLAHLLIEKPAINIWKIATGREITETKDKKA